MGQNSVMKGKKWKNVKNDSYIVFMCEHVFTPRKPSVRASDRDGKKCSRKRSLQIAILSKFVSYRCRESRKRGFSKKHGV